MQSNLPSISLYRRNVHDLHTSKIIEVLIFRAAGFDVFGAPGSEFRGVVPEDLKTLSIRSLMKRLVVFLYRTGAT